jgi:dCTP deaminase
LGLILPISQYANPSYEGKLPIIIYNASPVEVEIPPYYKVMQILFLELDGKAKEYKEQIDVKYFKENNIPNPKLDSDYNIEDIISELK